MVPTISKLTLEDLVLQINTTPFPSGKHAAVRKKTLKSRSMTSEKSSTQEKCQQGDSGRGWGVPNMRNEERLDFITSYSA